MAATSEEAASPSGDEREAPAHTSSQASSPASTTFSEDAVFSAGSPGRPAELPRKSAREERAHRRLIDKLALRYRETVQREEQRKRDRDEQLACAARSWRELAASWPPAQATRAAKHVRELLALGVPPAVRGLIWRLALGNALGLTSDLFGILAERGRELAAALSREAEARAEGGSGAATASREASLHVIEVDMPRTFPSLSLFQRGAPLCEPLREVLHAYACLRPDVGYVQGMSYLAAMFLLNLEPFDAFVALASLLARPMFLAFFRAELSELRKWLDGFGALVALVLPAIARSLARHRITPELYLVNWVMSLFTLVLSIDSAAHAWDCVLVGGEAFVLRLALALLHCLEAQLLDDDFEIAMRAITASHAGTSVEAALFTAVFAMQAQVTDAHIGEALRRHGVRASLVPGFAA